jgi:hypothetical protein
MKKRRNWRPALGCLVVVGAIFACVTVSLLGINGVCAAYLPQRLPYYPGAQVISEAHNFISAWGMGNTVATLYTPDDTETVRSWYGVQIGTFLRGAVQNPTPITDLGRQLARVDFDITRAEDGVGTQILLFGTCLN